MKTGEQESSTATEGWIGPFGPVPRYSVVYNAPFRPFALCAARELALKRTIKVAYDPDITLARLVAYETTFDRRFVYELDLREKANEIVLAEISVGSFSNIQSWRGEVTRALEYCEQVMGVET